MRELFRLYCPTFSINAMTGANKRYATAESRDWQHTVLHILNYEENKEKFARLRSQFDPKLHSYSVSITAHYPKQKFFTKQNLISRHTHDCSNFEKPLIDLLFLPKYFVQEDPYGAPNLNIDDCYITRLQSEKRASEEQFIDVTIEILARE